MPEHAFTRMTADEFLEWHAHQEQRHELIDGVPVAMAGAKRRHDQVVVNAIAALAGSLGVGRCRVFSSDTAVRISRHLIRYPDVGIDCGAFRDEAMEADAPWLVCEVLWDTTRTFDFVQNLEEYKSLPTLRDIVLVDTDEPKAIHWHRPDGGAWAHRSIDGVDAAVALPDLGMTLPLAALYAGLTFRPKPRLVLNGDVPASG